MKYALNLEPETSNNYFEFDAFEEEAMDNSWELDEHSDHECEYCSEFDPEYGESEWEVMRGRRVPQRRVTTRPIRIRPGMRRPRFRPRVIRRPGQVIGGPSICTCPAPNCPQHGSEYVRWVQSALNQIMNLRLAVTGIMNAPTRSALRSFQEKQGLPVDGIAGPETKDALIGAKGGKSPGAGAIKPAEPAMPEPTEPTATPAGPDTAEPTPPASEFDFVWEDAIDRFIGSEHRDIGDLALGQRPTSIIYDERGKQLTFGEMIALAGDYFETYEEMSELARTAAGRAKIAWARWHALDLRKQKVPEPRADKDSVMERYYVLASLNISHFSAGGTAWKTYMKFHSDAIATAFEAGERSDAKIWQRAISREGFACHFLTDMFSAGHIRTPRLAMRNWYRKNYPNSSQRFIEYMAKFMFENLDKRQQLPPLAWWLSTITKNTIGHRIEKLGGEAIQTFSLGDIVSLAIHDLDNRGLRVISDVDHYGNKVAGGHHWTAVGDTHLRTIKGAATKFIVVSAVKASFRELERVYDAGKKASGRKLSSSQRVDAVKKAIGPPIFAARAFVPREDLKANAHVSLPGAGPGIAPLEWRWGKLGNLAYKEVDITVKHRIADELFARLRDVPDVVSAKGQTIRGVRHAVRSFIDRLRADGIHVLEAAVGKKAK